MCTSDVNLFIRSVLVLTRCSDKLIVTSYPTSDSLFYYIVIHRRRGIPVGGTCEAQKVGLGMFLLWAEV